MRRFSKVFGVFVCSSLLVLTSCSDDDQGKDASVTSDGPGAIDGSVENDSTVADGQSVQQKALSAYYSEQCGKISACVDTSLSACFGSFFREVSFSDFFARHELELRQQCLEEAQDCQAVTACNAQVEATIEAELSTPPVSVTCGFEEEVKCGSDQLVWCSPDEEGYSTTPIVWDLSYLGKTCNAKGTYAADPEHQSCSVPPAEPGKVAISGSCDGPLARLCADGEILTWDCRELDPEFTCVQLDEENVRCGLPLAASQCEDSNINNSGNSASCDNNTAQVCAGGKMFAVDCTALAGGVCQESLYDDGCASCSLQ